MASLNSGSDGQTPDGDKILNFPDQSLSSSHISLGTGVSGAGNN